MKPIKEVMSQAEFRGVMTGSSHHDYDNGIPGVFSVASFITRITSL